MTDYAARRTMMVDTQVRPSDVTKFPIIAALLDVPREAFVPEALAEAAYVGENLVLAPGRVMLEPRSFAKLLDALDIQQGEAVLDVGCAYGYSTAVIARLAEVVVGVEEIEACAAKAQTLLAEQGVDNGHVHAGPLVKGAAKHGPYDVIVIEGAAEQVPQTLIDQLKDGGRIGCLFMEAALGVARVGYKQGGSLAWRYVFNASAPVLPGFAKAREFTL